MRSHPLSSFVCLTYAVVVYSADVSEDDQEQLCTDSDIGESAQSLLSSLVNVKLKQMRTGLEANTSGEPIYSNNSLAKHSTASLVVAGTQHRGAPESGPDSRRDYIVDGDQGNVLNAAASAASPVDINAHDASTKAETDSAVGAVVAAAAAELNKPEESKELAGWKPPTARSGGEEAEAGVKPSEIQAAKVHNLPAEQHDEPADKGHAAETVASSPNDDNEQIMALLGKMHMGLWMDVALMFLVITCCCCCLREMIASFREKQADDGKGVQERQIVSYDADRLVHLSILLKLFTRGSLCSKGKVWSQVTFFLVLWMVLTLILLSTIRYAAKLDDKSIRTLSSYLNSFMPFFFAMYLNVVFGRWWTMRTAGLGTMWQCIDDLCVILASHCPGERFESQRSTLLRYGLLSQALIYQVARKEIALQELVDTGILMPSELMALEEAPGSMPQTVWVWILDLWRKLHSEGHIEWWVVQHAQKLISEGRRAIKTIFTYVTCQIPFGWVHLMTFMVNITIIVLVLKASIITAKDIADMKAAPNPCSMDIKEGFSCNSDFHDQVSIFSQVMQLIIVPFLFLAFLEFTNELTNPFGEDPHDFPRHVYMCGMRDENLGFFHVAGKGTLVGAPPILANLK
jgi:predicted membrane chloride channel (bestrophin family)